MRRVAALLLVTMLLTMVPAHAHDPATWYIKRWSRDRSQTYRFVEGYPGGGYRTRVNEEAADWKSLPGRMSFTVLSDGDWEAYQWNVCPQSYGLNGIHWVNHSKALAAVVVCSENGPSLTEAISANMAVDSDPYGTYAWNVASGGPSSTQWDLRSVAAHEWGHMGGRTSGGVDFQGHWSDNGKYCVGGSIARHSLCQTVPLGTSNMRSLEQHDEDTFNNAYP